MARLTTVLLTTSVAGCAATQPVMATLHTGHAAATPMPGLEAQRRQQTAWPHAKRTSLGLGLGYRTAWPHAKRTSRSASQHTTHVRSLSYCAVLACAGAAVASPAA
eukprot:scaffold1177_cov72-Phaeocystis_antarctica.AAC.1